jgi:chromosome segregation ATPase
MSNDEARQIVQRLRELQETVDELRTNTNVLSWIASRFDKAVDTIERQQAIDDVLRELEEFLANSLNRIDETLLHILERLPEPRDPVVKRKTAELLQSTIDSTIRSLKVQQATYQRNLNELNEEVAMYGFAVPVEKRNQVKWYQDKLKKIEEDLVYYQHKLN